MTYVVPALTRAEVAARRGQGCPPDCPHWHTNYPVPHWPRSSVCRSSYRKGDDGVERLFRVHCTCDWCF